MELTLSQQAAYKAYQNGLNLFITGKGGSGKSFLTSQIVASAKNDNKNVLVCAPTGLAALNVGGVTIHRQFRIAPGLITPEGSARTIQSLVADYIERGLIVDKRKDRGSKGKKNIMDILVSTDIIVIDEISMCRCDLFSHVGATIIAANQLRQEINEAREEEDRKSKKKVELLLPIQVIVVGDFYQLPPILTDRESAAFHTFYKSVFAFKSPLWRELNIQTIELRESMRQKDKRFLSCLDSIREGNNPQLEILKECLNKSDNKAITLCGTNKQAHSINAGQLSKLKGEEMEYEAIVDGKVDAGDWQCDPILRLKVGARVIMLSNDKDKRWINGTAATIDRLGDDKITIRLDDNETAEVERYTWSINEVSVVEYKDNDGKVKKGLKSIVKATIVQFPMKLSWAISIHKSQGQTFENLNVNIDNIFCEGQLYVALSRCKSLKGLHITGEIAEDKVMVSEEVREFMTNPEGIIEKESQDHPSGNASENRSEKTEKAGKSEYQNGWDDGYDYRSKEVEEERKLEERPEAILSRLNNTADKLTTEDLASVGLRRIPDRSRREQEKDALPTEARNPRGAGRPSQGHEQKALKVPIDIIETIRDIVKIYWNNRAAIRSELERIISGYHN